MPYNNPHLKKGSDYAKAFAGIGGSTKALNERKRKLADKVNKPAK